MKKYIYVILIFTIILLFIAVKFQSEIRDKKTGNTDVHLGKETSVIKDYEYGFNPPKDLGKEEHSSANYSGGLIPPKNLGKEKIINDYDGGLAPPRSLYKNLAR